MPSIGLAMIVRNEAHTIERCLSSVRDITDTWVICDTGSNDGTQERIRDLMSGVPGELHERTWRDFGHNRSELMELAFGKADYLLLLDADHEVQREGTMPQLTADSYMVRHAGEPSYRIKRLVRGDRRWRFVGATHEYIESPPPENVENLDALWIVHHGDGGSRAEKFERDARLLAAELERDPSNPRTVFYLAQTHRDMGDLDAAVVLYEQRAGMGGWDEEAFYARYQCGVLHARRGDWTAAVPALVAAWTMRPTRIEPLYELARGYRERGEHEAAHLFATRALDAHIPDDTLFVHSWMYRYGVLFEYSIAAYWVGDLHGSLRACERLLENNGLPAELRAFTEHNHTAALEALARHRDTRG
jgi:tetratricopeptide (TPR) repeat protein